MHRAACAGVDRGGLPPAGAHSPRVAPRRRTCLSLIARVYNHANPPRNPLTEYFYHQKHLTKKMSLDLATRHEDDHVDNDTDGVVLAKGISMVVLFCASMICGLAPLIISKRFKLVSPEDAGTLKSTNRIVMTLLSFGGGVLLSTTFMHLMPEVDHNVEYLQGENLFLTTYV